MTIRIRLTLLFGLLVGSILMLFSVSVYYLYNQFREQEFQKRLIERATTTVKLRDDVGDVPAADLPILTNEQVTIYDQQGRVLYSLGKVSGRYPVTPSFLRHVSQGQTPYIRQGDRETIGIRYKPSSSGKVLVSVASAYDRYGFSKLERLRTILLFGWLLCLFIVAIAGYLFASDALRPVAELIDQANTISATNIHKRLLVGRQRDELADLARTFNELLDRLEKAFVSQKSFVSHASHELRTPLTVMMGQIEVTRLQTRSASDYETAFDGLLDEVKNMIRLVNGLLELARANTGFPNLLPKYPVRLDELLWQAQSQLIHKRPDYQIDIDFEDLPNQEDDLVVMGDESLLQTAFQNLMENGCKYSPTHAVMVRLSFQPQQVQIIVSDQGYGIPPEDLPNIFEPFYRSDSTMTVSGHGIGLALTKRIIDIHQGTIDVDSTLGKGTTFRVCLPNKSAQNTSATPVAVSNLDTTPLPEHYSVGSVDKTSLS